MADGSVDVEGLDSTLLFLAQLTAKIHTAGREGALEAVAQEASRVRARGASAGSQARLAARSVQTSGGSLLAAAGGGTPAAIFYGAEFGGGGRPRTRQFATHRGTRGYWFWPTLNADDERIVEAFADALDPILNDWEN